MYSNRYKCGLNLTNCNKKKSIAIYYLLFTCCFHSNFGITGTVIGCFFVIFTHVGITGTVISWFYDIYPIRKSVCVSGYVNTFELRCALRFSCIITAICLKLILLCDFFESRLLVFRLICALDRIVCVHFVLMIE